MDETQDWYILEWKDSAGREDSMAGPKSALESQKNVLVKNDIEHTFKKIGSATERATAPKKRTAKKTSTKVVADKELEVREDQ